MSLDPHFKKTVLALHFEGVEDAYAEGRACGFLSDQRGAVHRVDGSVWKHASTYTAEFDGRQCVRLGGTAEYYGVYGSVTSLFDATYTVELWFYATATNASHGICGAIQGSAGTAVHSAFHLTIYSGTLRVGSRGNTNDTGVTVPANQWHHVAAVCDGTAVDVYLNGAKLGRYSRGPTGYSAVNGLRVGYNGYTSLGMLGYVSDLRVYKGVLKYAADFTPAWPLPQFGRYYDSSETARNNTATGSALDIYTADSKFGGGCLRLDGASYLEMPASADWQFGTGDFTVEAWVKITADSAPDGSGNKSAGVWLNDPGSGRASMEFLVFGDATRTGQGLLLGLDPGSGWVAVSAAAAISQGAWHHIAVCRAVGTVSFFLDGAYIGGGAFAHSIGLSTNKSRIGGRTGYGQYNCMMCGLIDDVRVTKGVARYTEDFTPPTEAFPDGQASVTGVVRDAEGNPCSRKVFAHSRGNGRLLGTAVSDPVTGVYEIAADEACYVVCLDSTGSYNAKVIDGVDPTA